MKFEAVRQRLTLSEEARRGLGRIAGYFGALYTEATLIQVTLEHTPIVSDPARLSLTTAALYDLAGAGVGTVLGLGGAYIYNSRHSADTTPPEAVTSETGVE